MDSRRTRRLLCRDRQRRAEARLRLLRQKRTLAHILVMSALPPKADIHPAVWYVCFVPKIDIGSADPNQTADPITIVL